MCVMPGSDNCTITNSMITMPFADTHLLCPALFALNCNGRAFYGLVSTPHATLWRPRAWWGLPTTHHYACQCRACVRTPH